MDGWEPISSHTSRSPCILVTFWGDWTKSNSELFAVIAALRSSAEAVLDSFVLYLKLRSPITYSRNVMLLSVGT